MRPWVYLHASGQLPAPRPACRNYQETMVLHRWPRQSWRMQLLAGHRRVVLSDRLRRMQAEWRSANTGAQRSSAQNCT